MNNDPLSEAPPVLELAEVAEILERRYGVTGALTQLRSERDFNVKVTEPGGGGFVLKVQNPADGDGVVDFQTKALLHVSRVDPSLPVTKLVSTLDGDCSFPVTTADGRRCTARLFTYLHGRHPDGDELGAEALFGWGRTAARLGRALRGYFHPQACYTIQWDVRRVYLLRPALTLLADGDRRQLVTSVLDRFDAEVAPVIDGLRHQVVHGDLGLDNVLVDGRGRVTGIIDFGDMTHTALVCDLAVVLADVLDGRPDALEVARHVVAGYQSLTPLEPEETAILGDLVAARLATAVLVTAWRSGVYPENVSSTERAPAAGALRYLDLLDGVGLEQAALLFRAAAEESADEGPLAYLPVPTDELLETRRSVLGPAALTYDRPVHLVSGDGVWLFGADGRRYLDAYNNVPVAGHGHREVARKVSAQVRRLNANSRYLHEAPVELAARLLATVGGGLDRVLFVNSGSEANDVARRLATFATGAAGAVVTRYAYHGVTEATTELSPEGWAPGFIPKSVALVPAPAVRQGARGDMGDAGGEEPAGDESCAAELDRAVAELAAGGIGFGATFVDAAFTSDGILGPAPAYLRALAAATKRSGGLFVADEVQAGFGRTGAHLWSFAASGVEPDLVTLGKPMGNGFPVAAVLGRSEIVDPFMMETGYFSTFGGNTAAAVAGLAVLQVIEEEGLVANAAEVGAYLAEGLGELAGRNRHVGDLRAWGLLIGVELAERPGRRERGHELAHVVVENLRERGVLVGTTGPAGNIVKIRPPLVFRRCHADLVIETLEEVLAGLSSR